MFKRHSFFLFSFIKLFAVLMITEVLFRRITFETVFDAPFLGIFLFTMTLSLGMALVCSFLPVKAGNAVIDVSALLIAAYGITELQFYNSMGNYMSWNAVADGGGRIGQFVIP
ncbi:MAG: hypothetical protein IIZ48_04545, partial [Erysipelotrichales bacterium]|nr:hypothetical protein [Erysipelotrichales bacterium]